MREQQKTRKALSCAGCCRHIKRLHKALNAGIFGGRYKFRTCDPCRVKAVLYH